jgi:hypothetical protein
VLADVGRRGDLGCDGSESPESQTIRALFPIETTASMSRRVQRSASTPALGQNGFVFGLEAELGRDQVCGPRAQAVVM